jgi:hypothetical protein
MDTLEDEPFDPLDTSESVPIPIPIPIVGPFMAYTAMNRLRSLWNGAQPQDAAAPGKNRTHPRHLPDGEGVESGVYYMAKTFADTFNDHFQQQVTALSSQMQERVLPQAANLMGVWKNPQSPQDEDGWYLNTQFY